MSPSRTSRFDVRRESRRSPRRRSHLWLLLLLALFVVGGLVMIELGRAWSYAQGVSRFVLTADRMPPDIVKRELGKWAAGLYDYDPLVRRATMAAMKAVTGQNLGADPSAWAQWWQTNQNTWEYQPRPQP